MDDRDEQHGKPETIVDRLTDPETGRPKAQAGVPLQGAMLRALDMDDADAAPDDAEAQLDVNVDETFPASDPVSMAQPGKGNDGPLPGGKYE